MAKKKKDLKKKSIRISKENNQKKKTVKVKEDSKIFELEKNTIVGTYQKVEILVLLFQMIKNWVQTYIFQKKMQ